MIVANICVKFDQITEVDRDELRKTINLLETIDNEIAKCSGNAWEENDEFRTAAASLKRIAEGSWSY